MKSLNQRALGAVKSKQASKPRAVLKTQLQMHTAAGQGCSGLPSEQHGVGRAPAARPGHTRGQRLRPLGHRHLQEPPGSPRTPPRAIPAMPQCPRRAGEMFPLPFSPADLSACSSEAGLARGVLYRIVLHQLANN